MTSYRLAVQGDLASLPPSDINWSHWGSNRADGLPEDPKPESNGRCSNPEFRKQARFLGFVW